MLQDDAASRGPVVCDRDQPEVVGCGEADHEAS
jgi:hypothetical protein